MSDQFAACRGGAIGVHGFGRVGRAILRNTLERHGLPRVLVVNDVCEDENLLYLLRHDSLLGALRSRVAADPGGWWIGDQYVHRCAASTIDGVPWAELGVAIVIDASGTSTQEQCEQVIAGGVGAVVLTRASNLADLTVVAGVNNADYQLDRHHILSAGTCDGNAAALVLAALEPVGVRSGSLLTLHPSLGYQNVIDGPVNSSFPAEYSRDYALGRSATLNLIPKDTSLLGALETLVPDVRRRYVAMSYRVPTTSVSCLNLDLLLERRATAEEINALFRAAAATSPGRALQYDVEPLVSSDYRGSEAGATIDGRWTSVLDDESGLVRVVAWYDNETGYAHQVLRIVQEICARSAGVATGPASTNAACA